MKSLGNATVDVGENREINPYASPNTDTRKSANGVAMLINRLLIRLLGLFCIAGSVLSVFVPESMNWVAKPIVILMYRNLRNIVPGSLLMLLPYFIFAVLLLVSAVGLIGLRNSGRIAATVVCGIGITGFQLGAIPCIFILVLLWSPLSNQSFSRYYEPSKHHTSGG